MRKFTYSRIWKKTKRNRDKILRVGRLGICDEFEYTKILVTIG